MDEGVHIPLTCYFYIHKNKDIMSTDNLIKLITFPEDLVKGDDYFKDHYSFKDKYEFHSLMYDMNPKDFFSYLSGLCKETKISEKDNTLQGSICVGDIVEVNSIRGLFNGWSFRTMN